MKAKYFLQNTALGIALGTIFTSATMSLDTFTVKSAPDCLENAKKIFTLTTCNVDTDKGVYNLGNITYEPFHQTREEMAEQIKPDQKYHALTIKPGGIFEKTILEITPAN